MKFLHILSYCVIASGLAVPNTAPEAEVSVRNPAQAVSVRTDTFSSAGIFSRDQSKAWREAEKVVGRPLEHGKVYYFMSCNPAYRNHYATRDAYLKYVIDQTDCVHVGLVVGKTSKWFKKFEAEYLHVRVDVDNNPDEWYQSRHDWDGPIIDQRITFGGMTDSTSISKLWKAGKQWVKDAGNRMDADWNCLQYYRHLVSLI
ncbi:hypothetical protein CFIO01_01644 [Colletotrichum fioriniae PJ7]|uniref:Uncharacterized protein n=1 Tax=Colletotrichum fioriniae PJ7 TaxID=1445577 RepID=A0A010QQ59_9PEZI|nr:hypothetical protein CFIO01_01644 [Colletotrichum fioriniae PJ7]